MVRFNAASQQCNQPDLEYCVNTVLDIASRIIKLISSIMAFASIFSILVCFFLTCIYCSSFSVTAVPSYEQFVTDVVSKAADLGIPNPECIREFDNVRSGEVAAATVGYEVDYGIQECFPENHIYRLQATDWSWQINISVSYNRRMATQGKNSGSLYASLQSMHGNAIISRTPGQ